MHDGLATREGKLDKREAGRQRTRRLPRVWKMRIAEEVERADESICIAGQQVRRGVDRAKAYRQIDTSKTSKSDLHTVKQEGCTARRTRTEYSGLFSIVAAAP